MSISNTNDTKSTTSSPGRAFTERYLSMMFSGLRDATPEQVQEELEHCRTMNAKAVRVPRIFRDKFTESHFQASNGYDMQLFSSSVSHTSDSPIVVYFHGGACIYQPVFFHWRVIHDMAIRTHYEYIMPIYPKSPAYHCQDNVEALIDFYRHFSEQHNDRRIIFMGDSAGACIAIVLAQEIKRLNLKAISDLVLISPCVDFTYPEVQKMREIQPLDTMLQLDRIRFITETWRGDIPANHPWVSPIYGDLTALPANTILVYGSDEILKVDSEMLLRKMNEQHLSIQAREYPKMFHTFPMFPIREGFDALKWIVKCLK